MELREPQTKSRVGRGQLTQSWVVCREATLTRHCENLPSAALRASGLVARALLRADLFAKYSQFCVGWV